MEGASCCAGALRAKGEQEADLFVVSVLRPVFVQSCLCLLPEVSRGFPSLIGLAGRHISEIPLSMILNPNQTNKQTGILSVIFLEKVNFSHNQIPKNRNPA